MQIGQYSGAQIGASQPSRWFKVLKNGESRGWSLPLRNCYRTVQLVYRGGCDPLQQRVTLHDSVPTSLLKRGGEAVFRRDPRLCVIPGKAVALRAFSQPLHSDLDSPPIPECSVLLLQQKQTAGAILASSHPCHVQMHQSQQGKRFGDLANRTLGQDGSQTYRFVTKLSADSPLRVGR